ncbi:hypothetical protein ACFX13_018488 [Malus domestica]
MMEWEKQQLKEQQEMEGNGNGSGNNGNGGVMYVKVMTDEQLETLRKQIAVYATICEQLVEMHKNLTSQQDLAVHFMPGSLSSLELKAYLYLTCHGDGFSSHSHFFVL